MTRHPTERPAQSLFSAVSGVARTWVVACLLMYLSACASGVGPIRGLGKAEAFFPQEPYLTAARLAGRGNDPAALKAWLASTRLDVNQIGKAAHVPWSIYPDGLAPTLLTWAAIHNNVEAARALLDAGADPDRVAKPGSDPHPIHFAVWAKDDRLMQLLLQRGADPGARIGMLSPYASPLMMLLSTELNNPGLLYQGMTEAEGRKRAEALLKAGADINQGTYRPKTYQPDDPRARRAVNDFAIYADWRNVRWLLEHGADFMLPEIGDPPQTIACTLRMHLNRAKKAAAWRASKFPDDGEILGIRVDREFAWVVNYMAARGLPMDDLKLERKLPGCPH